VSGRECLRWTLFTVEKVQVRCSESAEQYNFFLANSRSYDLYCSGANLPFIDALGFWFLDTHCAVTFGYYFLKTLFILLAYTSVLYLIADCIT
jgi:hypothetical protein